MDQSISEHLKNLVKHINLIIPTSTIILFGSYANGTPTEDSDIDICVITNVQEKKKLQILRNIRKAISPILSIPVDILLYYESEFKQRASIPTTLEYKINCEGIIIYGNSFSY